MKRGREDQDDQTLDLVNCLMLLSKIDQPDSSPPKAEDLKRGRMFTCKTCNREFPSFQALGGHRASHKKPKLTPGGAVDLLQLAQSPESPAKPKTHECHICGLEFAVGQALGGHMRRHREEIQANAVRARSSPATPVLKKSNSSKRVSSFNLDLNLDLRLGLPAYHSQYDLATKLQLIS
ncbi:hypothetical protein ACE6H2_019527 [Prunus campanulata]